MFWSKTQEFLSFINTRTDGEIFIRIRYNSLYAAKVRNVYKTSNWFELKWCDQKRKWFCASSFSSVSNAFLQFVVNPSLTWFNLNRFLLKTSLTGLSFQKCQETCTIASTSNIYWLHQNHYRLLHTFNPKFILGTHLNSLWLHWIINVIYVCTGAYTHTLYNIHWFRCTFCLL